VVVGAISIVVDAAKTGQVTAEVVAEAMVLAAKDKIKRRSGHRFFENSYTFSSGQSLSKGLAFYGSQRGQGYFPASIASSLVSKIMAEVSSSTILQSMR